MNRNCHLQYQNLASKPQYGFTLVEILIGITLGTFLMAGIVQLFVGNKKMYKFQEEIAAIQENGRFALDVLTNSIRMANFTGCQLSTASGTTFTAIPVENVLNGNTDWWKNVQTGWAGSLVGYDGDAVFPGRGVGTNVGDRIANTDAIIALGGEGSYTIDTSSTGAPFVVRNINKPNGENLTVGGLVFACNATQTSLFQATSVGTSGGLYTIAHAHVSSDPAPGNNTAALFNYQAADSAMADFVPTAFYIGVGSAGGTSRSLYQMQLEFYTPLNCTVGAACITAHMVAQELVEGVADMQIFYGMGTANGNNGPIITRFFDATDVTSWSYLPSSSSVLSVRINLLLTSVEDGVTEQPQTYLFPDDKGGSEMIRTFKHSRICSNDLSLSCTDNDDCPPNGLCRSDGRLYKTFSTTVGIRNRVR